jgi:hypothetical protein
MSKPVMFSQAQVTEMLRLREASVRAEVAVVLDRYSSGEDPEECEPEDRWRLYRDMRVVTTGST